MKRWQDAGLQREGDRRHIYILQWLTLRKATTSRTGQGGGTLELFYYNMCGETLEPFYYNMCAETLEPFYYNMTQT